MGKASKSLTVRKPGRKNKRANTKRLVPAAADANAPAPNSCTDLGKKRVAVLEFKDNEDQVLVEIRVNDELPALCSPVRLSNAPSLLNDLNKTPKTPCSKASFHSSTSGHANNLMRTPKTPCTTLGRLSSSPSVLANLMRTPNTPCAISRFQNFPSACSNLSNTPKTPCFQEIPRESRLESLPVDVLVKVLCHLHHDQLRPAFHVSKRIREAVLLARQFHFNFTTPDRTRQALLNSTTPQPWEHWPFVQNKSRMLKSCPKTPKAPRHIFRPPPQFDSADIRHIADALFQESAFPSTCASSSSLSRSGSKSQLASNRVLFYSDELNRCNSLL
uniref:F-box domain-containing protein n=1 Tax=Kalanchoe fedtschenkoi TaxID=63787 RepID=A0A7N0UGS0_KALFE